MVLRGEGEIIEQQAEKPAPGGLAASQNRLSHRRVQACLLHFLVAGRCRDMCLTQVQPQGCLRAFLPFRQ